MRILLASSEVHPYSKTGGLADMVGALGKALARAGHEVLIVTPLYRGVAQRFPQLRRVDWWFDLPLGAKRAQAELWALQPEARLSVYFIRKPEYYDRAGLYDEHGAAYWDNGERFIFFSKCVMHLVRYLPSPPEIVHVHDWQTALVPLMIRHEEQRAGWGSAPRTCLTIHNLAYQGWFPADAYNLTNLPWDDFHANGCESYGMLNCLKAGIAFADVLTTVSPRYAREILTEEHGQGLDAFLRRRRPQLVGILNGVDYDEWRTVGNPYLRHSYSASNLRGKTLVKRDLLKGLRLPFHRHNPLFGTVTRLVEQKGMDILLGALHELLPGQMQFVLLGTGQPAYENAFLRLAARFPRHVAVRIGFDQALSHSIEAACDFHVMPSRFEPCGLNQMYGLRYGTIPIVRMTGGLDDSVRDARDDQAGADGIKFHDYSSSALVNALRKALALHRQPAILRHYRRNAMASDFSWSRTASQYCGVYRRA